MSQQAIDLLSDIETIQSANDRIRRALIGRTARIVSNYRDQPFGSSKPVQTGQVAKIANVWINPGMDDPVEIQLEGRRMYMGLEEVELL